MLVEGSIGIYDYLTPDRRMNIDKFSIVKGPWHVRVTLSEVNTI